MNELLINLANRAKTFGLYDLANILFGVLMLRELGGKADGNDLSLQLETNDLTGHNGGLREAYYDLLAICTASGSRLCVPVPLLDPLTVVTAMKRATVAPRLIHQRQTATPDEKTAMLLWWEFVLLVSPEESRRAGVVFQTVHNGRSLACDLVFMADQAFKSYV